MAALNIMVNGFTSRLEEKKKTGIFLFFKCMAMNGHMLGWSRIFHEISNHLHSFPPMLIIFTFTKPQYLNFIQGGGGGGGGGVRLRREGA